MKNVWLIIFPVLLLLGGCMTIITKGGEVTGGPLLSAKDRYVGFAKGSAKINEVMKPYDQEGMSSLILEAKLDMYRNRPLKENEYYSNFTTEYTYKYIRSQDRLKSITVVVSADVLSQSDTTSFASFLKSSTNFSVPAKSKDYFKLGADTFRLGEVVYSNIGENIDEYDKLEIMFIGDYDAQVKYVEKGFATEKIRYAKLEYFSTSKSNKGFKAGDKTKLVSVYDKEKVTEGVILGVNAKKILIATEFGKFVVGPERLKK